MAEDVSLPLREDKFTYKKEWELTKIFQRETMSQRGDKITDLRVWGTSNNDVVDINKEVQYVSRTMTDEEWGIAVGINESGSQ